MSFLRSVDQDFSKRPWNLYLKKYQKRYRLFRDEIGVWSIKCKYGFIQPFSIAKGQLVAVLEYKSMRGVNILIKKLQSQSTLSFKLSQHGDSEVNICFHEKDIKFFAELLIFGHVRQINSEQRKILVERLEKACAAKERGEYSGQ